LPNPRSSRKQERQPEAGEGGKFGTKAGSPGIAALSGGLRTRGATFNTAVRSGYAARAVNGSGHPVSSGFPTGIQAFSTSISTDGADSSPGIAARTAGG
jgi:hypothetical protein